MRSFIHSFFNNLLGLLGFQVVHKIPSMPIYSVDRIIDIGVVEGTKTLLKNYLNCFFLFIEPNPRYHDFIERKLLKRYKGLLLKFGAGIKNQNEWLYDGNLASSLFERNRNKFNNIIAL